MPFDKDIPTSPLVSLLHRKQTAFLNNRLKDVDLSSGLYPLLVKSYKNEGISQEELADALHINESTVTRNLKKLEDKGFIKRIPDKRTKRIEITEKGEKTARKVMDYDDEWDEKIRKIIGDEEYSNFKDTLIRISKEII